MTFSDSKRLIACVTLETLTTNPKLLQTYPFLGDNDDDNSPFYDVKIPSRGYITIARNGRILATSFDSTDQADRALFLILREGFCYG